MVRPSIFETEAFRRARDSAGRFCAARGIEPDWLLLCGHPKSGNTFLRFVYLNLINATNAGATSTLTYSQLNRAGPNVGFPDGLAERGFREPEGIDHRGFALLMHSHEDWDPRWREFGRSLYVYRNPLDTLIGSWYATQVFPVDVLEPEPIDAFVLRRLPGWTAKHLASLAADAVVRYEDLMRDDLAVLSAAFAALGIGRTGSLEPAVAMSRFAEIRRMEESSGERHGHRADAEWRARHALPAWRAGDRVRFTRSGAIGQWRAELQPATVERAAATLRAAGLANDPVIAPLFDRQSA